ncbi:hypothetical protein FDV58_33740 [Bradyrhizobium elkanii]|uniref:Uncharacterized protein n=1 Tax=Bradyrhizobium elkanii TaxID=29448 RepID=A0A4U6RIG9_BRAEL|nr:hypothetical protein [Bradyrhizobium elkanii]TKV74159.1 hypothetical protein FDV58_33740 [Bradyrhizobium elkanii]
MAVRLKFSALQQGRPYEYFPRFTLGGLATLVAGVMADWAGPEPSFTVSLFRAIGASDDATYLAGRERVCEDMRLAGVPEN